MDAATPPADRRARDVARLPRSLPAARLRRRAAWLAVDLLAIGACVAMVVQALA